MDEPIAVRYTFTMNNGSHEIFNIKLDPETLDSIDNSPNTLPEWTKLELHKCAHCPVQKEPY